MRTLRALTIGLTAILFATPLPADDQPANNPITTGVKPEAGMDLADGETKAKGKIVGIDLFKNGLAVVTCEVNLGKSGAYVLEDVPEPVHGTYHVDSPVPVETSVQMRDVKLPLAEAGVGDPQHDFANKKVTVYFKGGDRPPTTGTVLKFKPGKDGEIVSHAGYLVLKTTKGVSYLLSTEIASIETEEGGDTVTRREPRLVLSLGKTDKAETKVMLRYLTHGIAWAPSYRLDITDPKSLALEQHAVIRNELVDLSDAHIRLISGFPSVQFARVRSPMIPGTSWATYFSELANQYQQHVDVLANSIATQNAVSYNYRSPITVSIGATPAGEGVDLHYQPIGSRTLARGDSLALTVAKGKADYKRIVEWTIQDNRDVYGRYSGRDRQDDDEPWDALKFKNPLEYPMTTAPATVTANNQFNGQRTSYWVNPGEEMVLRVEKALSVRTRATENEKLNPAGDRDFIWIGGRQYRRSTVEGELTISNHRNETISMAVRRRFSGELVGADGDPKTALLAEGVYSVNKRNEVVWDLSLKAGEEKTLKYTYTVLVMH